MLLIIIFYTYDCKFRIFIVMLHAKLIKFYKIQNFFLKNDKEKNIYKINKERM